MGAREDILSQATKLFANQGFAQTSVREIVESAGVTKPTLYYYFGSKAGLFEALVTERVSEETDAFHEILASDQPHLERLGILSRRRLEKLTEDPDFSRLMGRYAMDPTGAPHLDLNVYMIAQAKSLTAFFQDGMTQGVFRQQDPLELALAFQGLLNFRFMAALCGGPPMTDHSVQTLLSVFENGVTP